MGASVTPHTQAVSTQPADWATDLALTIMAHVHRFPTAQATELIALELRAVRLKGESEGIKEAAGVAA